MLSDVPQYIKDTLKGEPVDFVVQSSQDYTKRSIGLIMLSGLALSSFMLILPLVFLFPLFGLLINGSTQITVNGTLETYTKANPWGAILFSILPNLFSLIFIIPMFLLFKKGVKYIRKKGSWYAGTNNYLIEFNDNYVDYYKWSEFENTYNTKINKNNMDIILFLKKPRKSDSWISDIVPNERLSNIRLVVNGQQIGTLEQKKIHSSFMNRIGLIGIPNGGLVFNMIKHNMERYNPVEQA